MEMNNETKENIRIATIEELKNVIQNLNNWVYNQESRIRGIEVLLLPVLKHLSENDSALREIIMNVVKEAEVNENAKRKTEGFKEQTETEREKETRT